jgi:hypothetical protein
VHELATLEPEWKAARLAARARGRSYYRAWLRRWRDESNGVTRLRFSDEEIVDAIREAMRGNEDEPVTFAAIVDRLAPGKPTMSEHRRLQSALVRMRKTGRVEGPGRWRPLDDAGEQGEKGRRRRCVTP